MEIIIRGRHVNVPSRFRQHAEAKLAKLEKLDHKVEKIDVEVSEERNPRQADRRERVELTIRTRGPAIRAEAAADDRYTALDLAFAKLESRWRRACDRRKGRHSDSGTVRSPALAGVAAPDAAGQAMATLDGADGHALARPRTGLLDDLDSAAGRDELTDPGGRADSGDEPEPAMTESRMIPIEMEGDGPVVLREKVHSATPMTIDQALLEMELVGHDFFLFHDSECDRFSVVYRRRGYDYGVIRLVEE
jgi:ribosomal subunit interface protein